MRLVAFIFFTFSLTKIQAQTLFTQNSNQTIWMLNSQSCNTSGPNTIENNSFIRVFDTDNFNVQDTIFFIKYDLGVESTTGGNYNLIGRIYKLDGTLLFANMSLLTADTAAVFPDSSEYFMNIFLDSGYAVPGDTIVAEIFAPINGAITFLPGSNPYPETGASYIAAAACGLTEPTEFATISFPTIKLLLNLWVNHKPMMSNFSVTTFKDYDWFFSKSDFEAAFTDYDLDTIHMLKISSLPLNGSIELYGSTLILGDTIYSNELDALAFLPNPGYVGTDYWTVKVWDGNHWSNEPTQIELNVIDWQVAAKENTTESFFIYPNPVTDYLFIQFESEISSTKLFSASGEQVDVIVLHDNRVDCRNLAAGVYYFYIETEYGINQQKLIKY